MQALLEDKQRICPSRIGLIKWRQVGCRNTVEAMKGRLSTGTDASVGSGVK